MQTILLVDDERRMLELLELFLMPKGYKCLKANRGEDALKILAKEEIHLVVLDVMMPGMDGWQTCEEIRSRSAVPILMLTARTDKADIVKGLTVGADDYLTKPFDPDELVAHVEAVLRRTGQFCQKITHGGLCIKPRKGEVLLFDKKLSLTKHEFNLLFQFMENPNIVLTREDLIQQLYPYADKIILDRTIDAHIKKLREKIEDDPTSPKRILTVRGMGYKFASE